MNFRELILCTRETHDIVQIANVRQYAYYVLYTLFYYDFSWRNLSLRSVISPYANMLFVINFI